MSALLAAFPGTLEVAPGQNEFLEDVESGVNDPQRARRQRDQRDADAYYQRYLAQPIGPDLSPWCVVCGYADVLGGPPTGPLAFLRRRHY